MKEELEYLCHQTHQPAGAANNLIDNTIIVLHFLTVCTI